MNYVNSFVRFCHHSQASSTYLWFKKFIRKQNYSWINIKPPFASTFDELLIGLWYYGYSPHASRMFINKIHEHSVTKKPVYWNGESSFKTTRQCDKI